MRKFNKYTDNLGIVYYQGTDWITSYGTKVAEIDYDNRQVIIREWWSQSTSKHINYATKELGFTKIETNEL